MNTFYEKLAEWWPLISPVSEYAEEAAEVGRIVEAYAPTARTLLELGSGGGHNAFYLKRRYAMTLTDRSDAMLRVSEALNPECVHIAGDMRTLALGRTFDVVFAHDAIDYMASEADLAAAFCVAADHLAPGGLFVCIPDHVAERFEPGFDAGGSDADDGRGVRYLEWTLPVRPGASTAVTVYSFITRDADGHVRSFCEEHVTGVFAEATWVRLLAEAGFAVAVLDEQVAPGDDRPPRRVFVARREG